MPAPVSLNVLPDWNTTTEFGCAAPNGLLPATNTKVEPLAKIIELRLVVPNGFPEKAAPSVNVAPLANVIALASTAVRRCAALDKVIEPLTFPVAPVLRAIDMAFATLQLRAEPAAIDRSTPVPPPIVNVTAAAACRVTLVAPETDSCPIVWVGTAVTIVVAPLLNTRTSSTAGVVRVGVQFVEVAHEAVPV